LPIAAVVSGFVASNFATASALMPPSASASASASAPASGRGEGTGTAVSTSSSAAGWATGVSPAMISKFRDALQPHVGGRE